MADESECGRCRGPGGPPELAGPSRAGADEHQSDGVDATSQRQVPSWSREWEVSSPNPAGRRGRASDFDVTGSSSISADHDWAKQHGEEDPAFEGARALTSSVTEGGDDDGVPMLSTHANVTRGTDEQLVRMVAEEWPNRSKYEFLGLLRPKGEHIWIHGEPGAKSVNELLRKRGIARPDQYSREGDRGILVSADGRCFIEQDWVWRRRVGAACLQRPGVFRATKSHCRPVRPPSGASCRSGEAPAKPGENGSSRFTFDSDSDSGTSADVAQLDQLVAPIQPKADTFQGDDSRTLITSIGYPSSAVAVALMQKGGISFAGNVGSASMIGPRHVLTVCHTFTENGDEHEVRAVAPARRGSSWNDDKVPSEGDGNSKFPHGVRRVKHYYWPLGWDGDSNRYDYGVLILFDQPFMPGYILAGTRPSVDLDYNNANMAGYPLHNKSCKDTPDSDGECGSYAYFEYGETTAGGTNLIYHKLDAQEGQSGAPMYWYDDGVRRVFMMHKGSEGDYGYAKRIRGGNFDSICEWVGDWPSTYYDDPHC